MPGQIGHNTRPLARLPLSFLGMDDLIYERSFDSQATWFIGVLGLFLTWAIVEPGTDRRSVDWCRD